MRWLTGVITGALETIDPAIRLSHWRAPMVSICWTVVARARAGDRRGRCLRVLIGASGLGPWQSTEFYEAHDAVRHLQAAERACRSEL